ncbi:hypothetical protein FQN60_006420 [Etheostoma spectabile]|uniref:Uncharacterized protein n=1 Tax=Etheostoma spectabile TaxID=54343 RepID=A0A5J5CPF4_9PERO|nr:hypothetical protein FQN60_006420 [Etheostoma spectabile]
MEYGRGDGHYGKLPFTFVSQKRRELRLKVPHLMPRVLLRDRCQGAVLEGKNPQERWWQSHC